MNNHKKLSASAKNGTQASENSHNSFVQNQVFQELREIKSEVKEVKKLLIIDSLRRLVANYDKQTKSKQAKLVKDWELAEKDKVRQKEIAEWDEIQAADENLENDRN